MTLLRRLLQILFYLFILAIILSRAVSSGINHDENQFITPGQLLIEQGLLPYRDYPYTHMPYAIPFYALAASVSQFDYLAARLLGVLTWLACIAALVAIFRLIDRKLARPPGDGRTWASLLGEFALVSVLVDLRLSVFLQGSALNHMLATLFSLLAFLAFMRGSTAVTAPHSSAFWSGLLVCAAGLTRFNYGSLVPVLGLLWVLYAVVFTRSRRIQLLGAFIAGIVIAALPAMILAVLAPAHFYYGNIVYIQLNTLYYRGIGWREAMAVPSKLSMLSQGLWDDPVEAGLYGAALIALVFLLVRLARRNFSAEDLLAAGAAAFAGTLFLTAFAPTPSQLQYFFAPLPFLLVLLVLIARRFPWRSDLFGSAGWFLIVAAIVIGASRSDPFGGLRALLDPSAWPPLQIHAFAQNLAREQHVPPGRVLAILPMIPSEAGYAAYPFTATGPLSWRTSLLLSEERRTQYGVVSPNELPALLDREPPVAILTGLEPPKAGFTERDPGGIERPFAAYAEEHGYAPVTLYAEFLQHSVTLWVRRP